MNAQVIERQFAKIGARAKLNSGVARRPSAGVSIDVGVDRDGEFFDIAVGAGEAENLQVVDSRPLQRHLLLMSRDADGKHKFLCGHDERHWFVAAVPEQAAAANVLGAMEAAKPVHIRLRQELLKVKSRNRNRRRNEAFVRQGEWFFVPAPNDRVDEQWILRNEPLRRGGGKPHMVEELVRQGGEIVYTSPQHPNGLTVAQYGRLLNRRPSMRQLRWMVQRRNAIVYVRGKIRHPDHKTIVFRVWHRVMMNTETQAVAMRHVAFID